MGRAAGHVDLGLLAVHEKRHAASQSVGLPERTVEQAGVEVIGQQFAELQRGEGFVRTLAGVALLVLALDAEVVERIGLQAADLGGMGRLQHLILDRPQLVVLGLAVVDAAGGRFVGRPADVGPIG